MDEVAKGVLTGLLLLALFSGDWFGGACSWLRKGAIVALVMMALAYGASTAAGCAPEQVQGLAVTGAALGAVLALVLAYLEGDPVRRYLDRQIKK